MKQDTFFYMGCSPAFSVGTAESVQKDVKLTLCQVTEAPLKRYTVCVVCKETGRCVPYANVIIQMDSASYYQKTDNKGECTFQLPDSCRQLRLQIKKEGYTSRYIGSHTVLQEEETFAISSSHTEPLQSNR